FDQLHDARHFVRREVRQAPGPDLFARDIGTGHDGCRDDIAARAGRLAVDLRLTHAVDLEQHLLDLARVYLFAGGVDQFAGAAGDGDLAVFADVDEIVGDEDAVREGLER